MRKNNLTSKLEPIRMQLRRLRHFRRACLYSRSCFRLASVFRFAALWPRERRALSWRQSRSPGQPAGLTLGGNLTGRLITSVCWRTNSGQHIQAPSQPLNGPTLNGASGHQHAVHSDISHVQPAN